MATTSGKPKEHLHHKKDGSLWAKGHELDGIPTGYWEWCCKDGVFMRSGDFENGEPTGEWTTDDKVGTIRPCWLVNGCG